MSYFFINFLFVVNELVIEAIEWPVTVANQFDFICEFVGDGIPEFKGDMSKLLMFMIEYGYLHSIGALVGSIVHVFAFEFLN